MSSCGAHHQMKQLRPCTEKIWAICWLGEVNSCTKRAIGALLSFDDATILLWECSRSLNNFSFFQEPQLTLNEKSVVAPQKSMTDTQKKYSTFSTESLRYLYENCSFTKFFSVSITRSNSVDTAWSRMSTNNASNYTKRNLLGLWVEGFRNFNFFGTFMVLKS